MSGSVAEAARRLHPVADLGIHVQANAEVSVYGLNRQQYTTDAYLGLPVDALDTQHIVMAWPAPNFPSQFAVVGTANGTNVTITPATDTDGGSLAGVPFNVVLNEGQALPVEASSGDLTGSIISSSAPVAVFGGNQCANIPNSGTGYCDHVVEQIPGTSTWGKSFLTVPLKNRLNGDTFRMLASENNTTVKVNGSTVATLNTGQVHTQLIDGSSEVTSDKPLLLAQFSNGSTFDGVTSDPFMMLIPPTEQFLASYTVTTPATGFAQNFLNLVVPTPAVASVMVDAAPLPGGTFTAIGSSGYSGAQIDVGLGAHTASAALPLGVYAYGFDTDDSYGYAGGASFAPVSQVTSVTLTPVTQSVAVGGQACLTATVLDQNSAALAGVRVDFSRTGTNPGTDFGFTDASGQVQHCYSGAAGSDTVKAAVGTLDDSSTVTWTSGSHATVTAYGGGTSVQYSDPLALSGTLTDAGVGVAGATLGFAYGTQSTTAGPTNASGTASTSQVVTQAPTSTTIATTYAGGTLAGTTYGASSDSDALTILKEGCTLTYTGGFVVPAGGSTTFSAQLGESDATLGDLSGKAVAFSVTDASNVLSTYNANSNASGLASSTQSLPAGVYSVTAAFTGDTYYNACSTAAPTVVTVEAAERDGAKVTGGGFLSGSSRIGFGFNAMLLNGVCSGQIQIQVTNTKSRFHGNSVSSLTRLAPNKVEWRGAGKWNGVSGYTFVAVVTDGGTGKKPPADTVSLRVLNSGGTEVWSASGPLKGGNITVHK
jgi:hypothetical protein